MAFSISFFNDTTQTFGAPITQGLQIGQEYMQRQDGGIDEYHLEMYSYNETPPQKWQKVKVVFGSNTVDFFVDSCVVEAVTKYSPILYKWSIDLVGLIKVTQVLPKVTLSFSNEIDSSGNPIRFTYDNVMSRINGQLFTMPYEIIGSRPFMLVWGDIPFINEYSPEFFFTDLTLYECLVKIGLANDSYPILTVEYAFGNWRYRLNYLPFNNVNALRHTINNATYIKKISETSNYAEIIESDAENVTSGLIPPITYPAYGKFKSPSVDEYVTEITDENAIIRLPFPVINIINIDAFVYGTNGTSTVSAEVDNIQNYAVEIGEWKTLPAGNWVASIFGTTLKQRRGVWEFNLKNIIKLDSFYKGFQQKLITENPVWANFVGSSNPRRQRYRVTYSPLLRAYTKTQKTYGSPIKPIYSIVNQISNVIDGEDYAMYLQGLAERMSGDYSVLEVKTNGTQFVSKGNYINNEIVVEGKHFFYGSHTKSLYTTSKTFSRKSEFIDVDHNIRQWFVPADKITDRNLHYAEDVIFSFDNPLPASVENINTEIIKDYIKGDYSPKPISLAYIAFKDNDSIASDANDYSINYALASVSSMPHGKSLVITWEASDNISMGSRSYDRNELSQTNTVDVQQFIEYAPKAEWLQMQFSTETPDSYIFNKIYTGVDAEGMASNVNFENTFPLSNKKQYVDAVPLITVPQIRIEKDLRERILFNYQLDFVGINNTIVANTAVIKSGFIETLPLDGLRIYTSDTYRYSQNDTKAVGTYQNITNIIKNTNGLTFETASNITCVSFALAETSGRLLFSKNANAGETIIKNSSLPLYISNRYKEYIKI